MNTNHCITCGKPLGITSRSDKKNCSKRCRRRYLLSLKKHNQLGITPVNLENTTIKIDTSLFYNNLPFLDALAQGYITIEQKL